MVLPRLRSRAGGGRHHPAAVLLVLAALCALSFLASRPALLPPPPPSGVASQSGAAAARGAASSSSSSSPGPFGASSPQSADLGDPAAVEALSLDRVGGTNHGPTRTEGSRTATVMGMASGYGVETYRSFVGSLRRSGFEGNIILIVAEDPKPGVAEYLAAQNVTARPMRVVNCAFDPDGGRREREDTSSHAREQATCADPYPDIKVRWSRFPLLRDYLEECQECTGPVLVCDVRDTFFQRDPFGVGAPEVEGLHVFQEHRTQTTKHWIAQGPISDCKGLDFGRVPYLSPMLCSGTTVGTREAMLAYLTEMHDEMRAWMGDPKCCCNKMNGDDQAIHNYLFYTGRLPYARAIPNRMGIVHTAGAQGSLILEGHAKHLQMAAGMKRSDAMNTVPYLGAEGKDGWIGREFDLTDEEGFLIDFDGGRSRVVHQFDRFGIPFSRYIGNKKGKLWEHLIEMDG